jgi:hypothetical protein
MDIDKTILFVIGSVCLCLTFCCYMAMPKKCCESCESWYCNRCESCHKCNTCDGCCGCETCLCCCCLGICTSEEKTEN